MHNTCMIHNCSEVIHRVPYIPSCTHP